MNLFDKIQEKREELKVAAKNLKLHFVGIDHIIDRIIHNLEVWYVLPEIINRPVIINLWGLTGVGKTDLVRRLVKELKFSDRFAEIQMDTTSGSKEQGQDTIKEVLQYSSIDEDSPGILLLDEIQRYRMLDDHGEDLSHDQRRFQDIWMLLSDGKFNSSGNGKNGLLDLLFEQLYWEDNKDESDDPEDEMTPASFTPKKNSKKKKKKYKTSLWNARQFKKGLRLKEPLDEVMTWDRKKKINIIYEKLADTEFYEGNNYSKLLIFISGNLDEAYAMADRSSDVDIDADTLHEFSKQITVVDVKDALARRFKPEQISRFGNTHVIYPALKREHYETIINNRIKDIVKRVNEEFEVQLTIDFSVNKMIYDNGVFPAQGVRPVLTTISSLFEANLPVLLLNSLENKSKKAVIEFKNKCLVATIKGKEYKTEEIHCDITKIRNSYDENSRTLISVHEAGHAIIYALLFKTCPTQIKCGIASFKGGFILEHKTGESKDQILNSVRVALAGRAAEEIVFGEDGITSGASVDIREATKDIGRFVRQFGMDQFVGCVSTDVDEECNSLETNIEDTNNSIEQILNNLKHEVRRLLEKHLPYLKRVHEMLLKTSEITPNVFAKISKPYIGDIQILNAKETIYEDYACKADKFFNTICDTEAR